MIQYAFSTSSFRNYSMIEALEKISAAGYQGVEIMCDRPHAYPTEMTRSQIQTIEAALDRTGLVAANVNTSRLYAVGEGGRPSWIDRERAARELRIFHTIECIRLAEALGAKNISVPAGGPFNRKTREEDLDLFMEGLDRVLPHAEECGIKVLVSAEPTDLLSTSDQLLGLMEQMRSPWLGIYCDVSHLFCKGEDPVSAMEKLRPYIGHIHLEDIAGSRIHQHLMPGDGVIDFTKILMKVEEFGYPGFISLRSYPSKTEEEAAVALQRVKEMASNTFIYSTPSSSPRLSVA